MLQAILIIQEKNDEPALAEPWPDKKVEHRTFNQDELVNQNLNKNLMCKDDSANAEPLCKSSLFFAGIEMTGMISCEMSVARIKLDLEPLSAVQGEAEIEKKAMVPFKSTRTSVTEASWKLLEDCRS